MPFFVVEDWNSKLWKQKLSSTTDVESSKVGGSLDSKMISTLLLKAINHDFWAILWFIFCFTQKVQSNVKLPTLTLFAAAFHSLIQARLFHGNQWRRGTCTKRLFRHLGNCFWRFLVEHLITSFSPDRNRQKVNGRPTTIKNSNVALWFWREKEWHKKRWIPGQN